MILLNNGLRGKWLHLKLNLCLWKESAPYHMLALKFEKVGSFGVLHSDDQTSGKKSPNGKSA